MLHGGVYVVRGSASLFIGGGAAPHVSRFNGPTQELLNGLKVFNVDKSSPLVSQARFSSLVATKPGEPPSGSFQRKARVGGAPTAPGLGRPVHGPAGPQLGPFWLSFGVGPPLGLLSDILVVWACLG